MSSASLHATATAKLTARKEGKANPRLANLFFWFIVIQVKRNDGESQIPDSESGSMTVETFWQAAAVSVVCLQKVSECQ